MRLAHLAAIAVACSLAQACASHATHTVAATRTPQEGGYRFEPDGIAHRLVTQCARVGEGDLVVVSGGPKDTTLLEDLAIEVRKAGGIPLIRMNDDRLDRADFTEVPARFDASIARWRMHLAELADVEIVVESGEDESILADVAPERIAAQGRAGVAVGDTLLRRGVRQIYLGNDLRPTADRAKRFRVPVDELARLYRAGLDVDFAELAATGDRLRSALERGHTVRVTSSNGTDLSFEVTGRRAFTSDGVISEDDARRGGAALQVWLPAGEAYVTPVPGTAQGRIVMGRDFWNGVEFHNLVVTFQAGRMTAMKAESGDEGMRAEYAAAGEGKDLFGGVDVGFNPGLIAPPGSDMKTYAMAGNVTFAIGLDTWVGGSNTCEFGFSLSLQDATLTIDGKPLVQGGRLVR